MVGKYKVITLCGSTRFKNEFLEAQKRLTLDGNIVISVGLFGHAGDDEVWENMDEGTQTKTKEMLDDMHKRKIDMADEIYVINVGGYIGKSTKSEIEYAKIKGKKVNYLESMTPSHIIEVFKAVADNTDPLTGERLEIDDLFKRDDFSDMLNAITEKQARKQEASQTQTVLATKVVEEKVQPIPEATISILESPEVEKKATPIKAPRVMIKDGNIIRKDSEASTTEQAKDELTKETIKYNGKTYYRRGEKWEDEMHIIVHETLQRELNDAYSESQDLSNLSYSELVKEADKFKESSSHYLAIRYYEEAVRKGGLSDIKYVFPRITSCYRKKGQAKKAVNLFSEQVHKYGNSMITPALLTSVAAAYCDIEDFEMAKKCCDRAYAMTGGNAGEELQMVYKRLNQRGINK